MSTEAPGPLETLREDWERLLCVVAHPDDLEFGAAAAVARWTGQGKQVVYCMVTSGEAGIDAMPPEECRPVREAEQVESARVVGVDTVDFLGPWGGANLNQADHIAVGKAVLDAVRDAGNRWVFTEQLVEGGGSLEKWGGVGEVWAFGSPQATHAVDTTATFDAGVASLEAHRAYIDGLGWEHFDPREFLEGMARATGQRLGCAFAAPFEVFPMGWGE